MTVPELQNGGPALRSTPPGGVWAPGGPPRLQNECAGEELAGGFDSRPPPRGGNVKRLRSGEAPHPPRDLTTSPRRQRGRLLALAAEIAVADVLAPLGVAFAHRQVGH